MSEIWNATNLFDVYGNLCTWFWIYNIISSCLNFIPTSYFQPVFCPSAFSVIFDECVDLLYFVIKYIRTMMTKTNEDLDIWRIFSSYIKLGLLLIFLFVWQLLSISTIKVFLIFGDGKFPYLDMDTFKNALRYPLRYYMTK